LGRGLDPSGAQSLRSALAAGVPREEVAKVVLRSLESDTDEAAALYRQFLHRAADPGGLASVASALNQGVPNELAIQAMITSDEYFAQP
jgi:hypothetical protein